MANINGDDGNNNLSGTNSADTITGGGGNDSINGNAGDDRIIGDGATTVPGPAEVGVTNEGGVATLLVWDASTLSYSGGNPFVDGTSGLSSGSVAGRTMTFGDDTQPVAVGVQDGSTSHFNDGDSSQDLVNNEFIDGVSGRAGDRITPEYQYSVRNVDTGEVVNVYAVELNGNKVVGFVTDAPMEQGATYEFLSNVDTHPSVPYGDLATTYIDPDGGTTTVVASNAGDDTIDGGAGDDTIFGDNAGADGSGMFTGPRESFNWDLVSGSQADNTVTQDTGDVNVTYTRTQDTGHHDSDVDNSTHLNVSGIDSGSETIDTNSALNSETNGNGNTGAFRWEFSEDVGNVDFNINDLDGDGVVTVRAYDSQGNEVPVSLTGGSNVSVSGNTASGDRPYLDTNASANNVQVDIAGPVSRIELVHTQQGSDNSGIWVTDIYYDTGFQPDTGEGGDDEIDGGEGDDLIFGQEGNDTVDGGTGQDTIYGDNSAGVTSGAGGSDATLTVTINSQAGAANGALLAEVTDIDGNVQTFTLTDNYDANVGNTFSLNLDAGDTVRVGITAQGNTIWSDNSQVVRTANVDSDSAQLRFEDDGVSSSSDFDDVIVTATVNGPATVELPGNAEIGDGFVGSSGELGDDSLLGGDDNDVIYGDDGDAPSTTGLGGGAAPVAVRESFNWEGITDGQVDSAFQQDTGENTVTFTRLANDSGGTVDVRTNQHTAINTDNIDSGGETVDNNSSMTMNADNNGGSNVQFGFDTPVENISFNIADIDSSDNVQIRAFDANGDPVEVVLTPVGNGVVVSDNDSVPGGDTATDPGANWQPTDTAGTVTVTVAGPVSVLQISHNADNNIGVHVSDIYFDTLPVADGDDGEGGDDTIEGGAGADSMFGEGGDDTFVVDTASDADGDVIVGGNGPDDSADNDVLDLTGAGPVTISETADDNDAGATKGTVTFEDGSTLTFEGIEQIITDPVNSAPTAVDDDITVNEDESVTFDPTANDTDPDGDDIAVDSFTQPANGTVTQNPDGTLTYTPDQDYNGSDSFEVTVTDPSGETSTSTVNVSVTPVNDAPEANPDTASGTEDGGAVTISPLANDTDVDGDDLRITGASVPADQGTVTFTDDMITFTPAENFNGPATISYAITDDQGGTDTSTVTVNVTPVNDAPDAVDDVVDTDEDTPVTFDPTANDSDVDGDPLSVSNPQVDPAQGTVTIEPDGQLTFTPAPNFNGPVTITYDIIDGNGGVTPSQAVVNVGGVIDPPVANDDDATTDEDVAVTIDVLANDTDPENQDLTITAATLVDPTQGSVEIVGNELVFTPAENFNGVAEITYSIVDTEDGTDTAMVTVVIDPVNDLPVTVDDIQNTDEDVPITFDPAENDTDVENPGELKVVDATIDPALGTVEVDPTTGEITYTPAPDYNGPAPITYTVEDPDGGQSTGTALVNVGPVNDAPEAEDDTGGTLQGTPVTISPLANDSDPDGDDIKIIAASVPADQGTVTFTDDTITFTPAPAFVGDASISYTIADPEGLTDTADVVVTVTDVIGPVDGTDDGEVMTPGYTDAEGDEIDGADGLNDTINGNGGDDTIDGGAGDDTIDGGADNDSVTGGAGDDVVGGGDGSDTIAGGAGEDTLEGGAGDDDIAVGGNDDASGGTGDDVFTIDDTDPATDVDATIDGGSDGTDGNPDGPENGDEGDVLDLSDQDEDLTVVFDTDPEDGTVDGLDGDASTDIDFEEIEEVITGSGDDTVDGSGSDGPIDVTTNDGDDTVTGTDGDDTVDAGGDDDVVTTGDGNDSVDGGDGDNEIDTSGNNVDDPITGQTISGTPDRGYPGLFTGDSDPNDDLDTVVTGDGNDTITTGDDNDSITSGGGDDVIDGGFDDDTIDAGAGNDSIIGGEGADSIDAGDGDDTVYAGNSPLIPDNFNIPDEDLGGLSPDLVPENGRDTVSGGEGDDVIFGADDDDLLMGDEGDDQLDGGIDDDTLIGGVGNDTLIGGQGSDDLQGGDDRDVIDVSEAGDGIGDTVDGGSGGDDFDVLDLRGSAPDGGSLQVTETGPDSNGNGVDGFVTYFDEDGNEVGRLDFAEIEQVIPCFTPGTLIATHQGERRVEDLEEGDLVITRDNGIQPIQWIGRREMEREELAEAEHLRPILIKRGALGNGLPERDMMVSPQHRVLISSDKAELLFEEREVLVSAKHLVGMEGVEIADVPTTTYIHIMFGQHEVVLSDGAWTESFQPGDHSLAGIGDAQRREILTLFPELETRAGIEGYIAARRILRKHEAELLTH